MIIIPLNYRTGKFNYRTGKFNYRTDPRSIIKFPDSVRNRNPEEYKGTVFYRTFVLLAPFYNSATTCIYICTWDNPKNWNLLGLSVTYQVGWSSKWGFSVVVIMKYTGIYPLVNVYITIENHHFIAGKTHYFNGYFIANRKRLPGISVVIHGWLGIIIVGSMGLDHHGIWAEKAIW